MISNDCLLPNLRFFCSQVYHSPFISLFFHPHMILIRCQSCGCWWSPLPCLNIVVCENTFRGTYCPQILCMYMCLVTQLCPALCNLFDCSPPGPFVHGISQARILEWVAISFSRGSSQPRDQTLCLLHCRRIIYPLSILRNPIYVCNWCLVTLSLSGDWKRFTNVPHFCQFPHFLNSKEIMQIQPQLIGSLDSLLSGESYILPVLWQWK